MYITIIAMFTAVKVVSCSSEAEEKRQSRDTPKGFASYWYQGKAEITHYDLQQSRYGEIRDGRAVLIFVTEDFSKEKHVKLENPQKAGSDAEKILKLNFTKKFITGIYPYSMMTSVFTPVKQSTYKPTLKITATSQEWCSQTFSQLNRIENGYKGRLYSYFESEGDQQFTLKNAIPEDELWNRIRLAPKKLPTGDIQLIPGTLFQRLSHSAFKTYQAKGEVKTAAEDSSISVYTVSYKDLDRRLSIRFTKTFPYKILGWEETHNGQTTTAKRKKSLMIDYWNKNNTGDRHLRKQLDLE